MWIFWGTLAVTLLLQFGIPLVSKRYGAAVEARFVERLKIIPGSTFVALDLPNLKDWIVANPESARGYACPVLWPLDFVFMFALAGVTASGALLAAPHAGWVSSWPWRVWCIIPAIYLAADFIEDVLLVGFLRNPASLSDGGYAVLSAATSIKIKSATAAIIVTVVLGLVALTKVFIFPTA